MDDIKKKASEVLGVKDPNLILKSVREWSSNFSDNDHIVRSVVQEIYQNCELNIDRILYLLLSYGVPLGTNASEIDATKEELWEEIGKMSFQQKYRLLKPIFKKWCQTNPSILEVEKINKVRSQCAHIRSDNQKNKIEYAGIKLFVDAEGVAKLFLDAWGINKGLGDLYEWIADCHATLESNSNPKT